MQTEETLLKNIPVFETLDATSLKKLAKLSTRKRYKKGAIIIKEGELGNSLFIILEGEVEVVKAEKRTKKTFASLKPFDFFGEMAILENKPRSATVIARKDSTFLIVCKSDFEKLIVKHPNISFEIMKTLSARIRDTDLNLIQDLRKKNKELKTAYANLKNMQNELIKSEKLTTIGKVSGGIIHDLKNPLSVVKGYAEYLKQSKGLPEPVMHAATTILHVVNIILNMTQEVLEFSKDDYRLEKIPIKIDKLINEISVISAKELEKSKVELVLYLNTNCHCEVDPQKIRRVFFNIISNAKDAMLDGGNLTIYSQQKDNKVLITFQDTGIGIDSKTLKNIFEPFYSKGKRKGIGLGMSIAKRIIEEHGGSINVKSKEGKGTLVTISIPICE